MRGRGWVVSGSICGENPGGTRGEGKATQGNGQLASYVASDHTDPGVLQNHVLLYVHPKNGTEQRLRFVLGESNGGGKMNR